MIAATTSGLPPPDSSPSQDFSTLPVLPPLDTSLLPQMDPPSPPVHHPHNRHRHHPYPRKCPPIRHTYQQHQQQFPPREIRPRPIQPHSGYSSSLFHPKPAYQLSALGVTQSSYDGPHSRQVGNNESVPASLAKCPTKVAIDGK